MEIFGELLRISIHALVKRATVHNKGVNNGKVISIHALVKRATSLLPLSFAVLSYFNPRPREEGDIVIYTFNSIIIIISIHALVKRATCKTASNKNYFFGFQSTPS